MKKLFLLGAAAVAFSACGGSSSSAPTPVVTQPPVPAAAITATGSGALVLHPSANPAFLFALETPMRITETAGGSADWGFARFAIFNKGVEVERAELGATQIQAFGFSRIAARSDKVYGVFFRFNSQDFDRIDITLGFSDLKDGRVFTASVPFGSFSDVQVSFTPLSLRRSKMPI